jgi:hypothetical protein
MIKMQLEILGKNDTGTKIILDTITIEQNESSLQLTLEYLISLNSEISSVNSVYGFNAYIFSVDGILEIYDFEYITLEAFRNTSPNVSTLKVVGAKNSCNINNVEIRHFEISDQTS